MLTQGSGVLVGCALFDLGLWFDCDLETGEECKGKKAQFFVDGLVHRETFSNYLKQLEESLVVTRHNNMASRSPIEKICRVEHPFTT